MFFLSFTESLMTYGLGRRVEYFDMPAIRKIVRDAAKDDNRFSAFVAGSGEQPRVPDGARGGGRRPPKWRSGRTAEVGQKRQSGYRIAGYRIPD